MTVLLVGLASGVLALALTRGTIFDPIRSHLAGLALELFSCPLCLGAWLSAALWGWQGPPPGLSAPVAWGASWAISTAFVALIERLAE